MQRRAYRIASVKFIDTSDACISHPRVIFPRNMLNPRQKNFCREYVHGEKPWNAEAAALAAGYTPATAYGASHLMLRRPEIVQFISELCAGDRERIEASRADIIEKIHSLSIADARGLFNPDGSPKLPHEIDDVTASLIAGIDVTEDVVRRDFSDGSTVTTVLKRIYKYKLNDRGGLRMAAEHLNLLKEHQEAGRPVLQVVLSDEDRSL